MRDVAQRARLPRDVIQRWGNIGILHAEEHSAHGGRGVHRRFQVSEMIIAILLRPFAPLDVPSGQLLRLSGVLRTSLGLMPGMARGIHYEEGAPEIRQALLKGAYGLGDAFLAVTISATVIRIEPVTGDGDEAVTWNLTDHFGKAEQRPEVVHILDLATLRGVLGDLPPKQ